jgi:quinol monooxygenase YgiN
MLLYCLRVKAKPEKKIELEKTLVSICEIIQSTNGCIECIALKNIQSSSTFHFISTWQEKRYLNAYFRSKNHDILEGAIRLLCNPPEAIIQISQIIK